MRFNGDPVDPERPESVLNFINRPIVRYNQESDITPLILDRIRQRAGGATGAAPRTASPFGTPATAPRR